MTDLFFRFSMHNILSLHSSTKDTIKTSEEEFSNTFGNICRLTFNVSFLNTMYLSGSSPDVSRKQQQQKTIKKHVTEVSTTTKITTIFLLIAKKVRMATFKGGVCKMVSSFLIKAAGVMLNNCVWKYHLNRARITLTLLMHWIGYSSFHLALNDFVLTFQVFFSCNTLFLSLSLSIFSPMLTNTSNLMHGFKLLFSNWTPNTCEEAYMSILSIRRHLTFLRLHTLCSKLLSCCCFYCHYDAYTSQLVIGSRSHHTSHSGGI